MEGYCRSCLREFDEPAELLQYSESNRRLYVYCTGLQVKRNDAFTFQLCKECFLNLKFACKFKKQCRTSDKKFKTYLGLKNEGASIEFKTYLKNIDDTFTLRLPEANRGSSPPYQIKYDENDDNESTCTSIQNFITDIHDTLQGEDILPTEANIIREVIQEEADISDDSLDSHWLQDEEVSIDNDFGMDFNFAGYSTPHNTSIDRCNTLEKISNEEDDTCHYIHKDVILKSDKTIVAKNKKDMSNLDVADNDVISRTNTVVETDKQQNKTSNRNDMPLLDGCHMTFKGMIDRNIPMSDLESNYEVESVEKINKEPISVMNKKSTNQIIDSPFTTELEFYMNKVKLKRVTNNNAASANKFLSNDNSMDSILNQRTVDETTNESQFPNTNQYSSKNESNVAQNIGNVVSLVKNELEQYIDKAELKKISKDSINCSNLHVCSIDKNLELALKNENSQEFPLDQLLISPQVSLRSEASTPTINNILFGNISPKYTEFPVPDSPIHGKSLTKELTKADRKPKEEPEEIQFKQRRSAKDLDNLKKSLESPQRIFKGNIKSQSDIIEPKYKTQTKRNKGYKDINKLKDLIKIENEDESDESLQENIGAINKLILISVSEQTSDDKQLAPVDNAQAVQSEDDMYVKVLQNTEPDDLDISINNLLDFDGTNSVDLNISIASDFLEEDIKNNEHINNMMIKIDPHEYNVDDIAKADSDNDDKKDPEILFKMPLPPPDDKYDLDKGVCKICAKEFKTSRSLKMHFVKVHKQLLPKSERNHKPRVCPICGKAVRDCSNFNRHMKSHQERQITCQFCTLVFPTRGRYNLHLRSHATEIKDIKKMQDGNDDSNEQSNSKDVTMNPVTPAHVCTTCGKAFKSVSNFNVHVKRHTTNYTMRCDVCQKGFFRTYDLKQHMAKHNNDHPFACQYCGKKYKSRYMLVGHIYRHLGKKKFACDVCDQEFDTNQSLRQHLKTEKCAQNRKAFEEGRPIEPPKKKQKILGVKKCPKVTKLPEQDESVGRIGIKVETEDSFSAKV